MTKISLGKPHPGQRPSFLTRTVVCGAIGILLAAPVWAIRTDHGNHDHGLAPIDALAQAPLALQQKAAPALPVQVLRMSREERLGVPTFVQLQAIPLPKGTLQTQAAQDPASAARKALKTLANLYGLTPAEVDAAPLDHVQTLQGGARLVRLTNQRDGVEVFREQATVLLDAQSRATTIGGFLASTALAPAATLTPRSTQLGVQDATTAIARVLQDWGFDANAAQQLQRATAPEAKEQGAYSWWTLPAGLSGADGAALQAPVRTKPVWFRLPQGLVSAHYVEVQLRDTEQEHAYAYVVADDGRLLWRNSQISHSAFSYRVPANDTLPNTPHPGHQGRNGTPHPTGLPNGYSAANVPANLVNLANVTYSQNDPWLAAGATRTQGNNVRAFANLATVAQDPVDSWGPVDADECNGLLANDFRACTTAPGVFDYSYDHNLTPLASKGQAAASVVNLFFTTNWLHNWFYDAGFDEAAGNAQANNFGRGGLGGDAMNALALDHNGTDNANMYTPADGAAPRMRMYRFINQRVQAEVSSPAALLGTHQVAGAQFGAQDFTLTGEVVATSPADGCATLGNAAEVNGKIALVARGNCAFDIKARNAQIAGATAVIVVNNVLGAAVTMGSGSVGGSVTIPAIQVARDLGNAWRASATPVTLRMQGAVTERSSALDNTIIAHEWGHFISNRLIGNGSGLGTNHSSGLGEGWGDFHALLMIVAPQDIVQTSNPNWTGAYGIAGYSLGTSQTLDLTNAALYGLRRYPYSTNLAKNPLTLRHLIDGVALPGAVPTNANDRNNAQTHNMGEVWASMLWEFYASLLNAHAFQEAQDRMKRYLVAGYKLTPVNPTLTEARDALLAAAGASDPADQARGVTAFAKRGAGVFAQVPDRYSTTNAGVVESFAIDGALKVDSVQMAIGTGLGERCDADEALDFGETGILTIQVSNQGYAPVSGAQVTLSADIAELMFPDGAVTLPTLVAGASITVTARVQLASAVLPTGARIKADIVQVAAPAGFVAWKQTDVLLQRDQVLNRLNTDNAEAAPSAMEFGSSLASAANTWHVRAQDALPHERYYAAQGASQAGSHWMRTPALQVAATGDFRLAFSHRYTFEADSANYYDGGQLMISVDGGAWTRLDVLSYSGVLFTGSDNPAAGQRAYVGNSAGWLSANVNLGTAYAGKSVRLAWVVQEDLTVVSEGWQVDDIVITGITNTPFPEVVADAQLCTTATLSLVSGTLQSAPTGTAFGLPLRVRLQSPGGTPLAGLVVAFSAPVSGATAALTATVFTDADGYAMVTPTAGSEAGSYVVTATASGQAVQFDLRNTGASAGTGSGAGGATPLSISGAAPGGLGVVTATVTASTVALPAQAYFSQKTFAAPSGAGVPAMSGHDFPFGLMGFALENVGVGNAITLRIRYPAPVPTGAEYWKYGRTTPGGTEHWHQIPMTLVGGAGTDTIEITLTDGGTGDTDAKPDGTITDPGGLRVLAALPGPSGTVAAIPALEPAALAALGLLLGGLARRRLRRQADAA